MLWPVLKSTIVNVLLAMFIELLGSPIGPALMLMIGVVYLLLVGRLVRKPGWLTGSALVFVALTVWLLLGLRTQSEYPIYSRPWHPLLQSGTNLEWVGDGWNWYVSGLIILLGGVGILLDFKGGHVNSGLTNVGAYRHTSSTLAVHLGFLATALLFVSSSNLLTVILMWVLMDLLMLVRSAMRPDGSSLALAVTVRDNRVKGLSLLGALLLLIGLLPAGPTGPGQPLDGGLLPIETVFLMLIAAAIRAGAYPLHLWLLPTENEPVDLSERLIDQMVSVLCGLWLLGWAVELGGEDILLRTEVLALIILALLGSATAAWTAPDQPNHTTFVLITSTGLAALAGVLGTNDGPAALIWPTTVFALGGGLWLVGERVWQEWGWQFPVSVGALALSGAPYTPGFLTQPGIARLLTAETIFFVLFIVYVIAQTLQIAALLRSWGAERRNPPALQPFAVARLIFATLALGFMLAFAGFLPQLVAALANMPDAIPALAGTRPTVVAAGEVWVTWLVPLVMGIALARLRPQFWNGLSMWPTRINHFTRLEWLFQLLWWSINRVSNIWGNVVGVVEGAGYMGWLAVFLLLGYLLVAG